MLTSVLNFFSNVVLFINDCTNQAPIYKKLYFMFFPLTVTFDLKNVDHINIVSLDSSLVITTEHNGKSINKTENLN